MRSKKGAVLAYVIIIGAALIILAAMAALAANSSITMADTGIKTREAYLNAKSGVEYSKVIAMDVRTEIYAQLSASPSSITTLEDEERYAYYDVSTGFHNDPAVTSTSAAFLDSPIQITYLIDHTVTEIPPATTDEAISYDYDLKIVFDSVGRSIKPGSMIGFMEDGISLKYVIEPLSGTAVMGSTTEGEATEEVIISSGSAFDCNLSADMSCYLRGNGGTTASLYSFNNGTTYATGHSIVYSKPIRLIESDLSIRANKIYFKGSPSINTNRETIAEPQQATLNANYIYIGNNLSFTEINDDYQFNILSLDGTGSCTVFFDNVYFTVSYYDDSSVLHTENVLLDGYYQLNGPLFQCIYGAEGVTFQWADFSTLKITSSTDVTEASRNFDPYLTHTQTLGISAVQSGRYANWAVDSGTLSTADANSFSELLSFLQPPSGDNNAANMVIVYANSLGDILDNDPLELTAKQIRVASSMSDSPPTFTVPANKQMEFNTDMLMYYGGNIIDGGTNNSFIINSLSGQDVVPVYFEKTTGIGSNLFLAGYTLVASGSNLFEDEAAEVVTQEDVNSDYTLTAQSVLFEGDENGILYIGKLVDIVADGPTCVTINTQFIDLGGPGVGNVGELTLDPSNGPITLYIVQDLYIRTYKHSTITSTVLIKAGFYSITTTTSLGDLQGDSSPPPEDVPPDVPSGTYDGVAFETPYDQQYGTSIIPIFTAPGVPVISPGTFNALPIAEFGGIYY